MESIKQQQVGSLIQRNLSEVFQKEGFNVFGKALVTISAVRLTSDLRIARAYLSIYNVEDKEVILEKIREKVHHIKARLVAKIRNKVRAMPELEFYLDDTLDEVFKLEELFKELKKDKDQ